MTSETGHERVFRRRLNGSMFALTVVTGAVFLVAMGLALLGDDPGWVRGTIFVLCVLCTFCSPCA